MSVAEAVQTTTKPEISNSYSSLIQRKCACGGSSGLSGECDECKTKRLLGKPLQAKLRINEPGDEYEREADRVADQVMCMPDASSPLETLPSHATPLVQRRTAGNSAAGIGAAPPIVQDVLSSPGRALDTAARAFFEPRFGHDFGQVRIHSDAKAAESAQAVNAMAYTVGRDIVFDSGRYAPGLSEGRRLVAHELAHSVQQSHDASPGLTHGVSSPMLDAAPVGPITRRGPLAVARQPVDTEQAPNSPSQQRLFEAPDPESAVQVAIDTLASIRFVEADRYVLEAEGAQYEFNERQYQELKITTRASLRGAINSLRTRSAHIEHIYSGTLETNEDYWVLTKVIEYAFGVDKPGEELTAEFERARLDMSEAEDALSTNTFSTVLERLISTEAALIRAEQMVDAYRQELNSAAETISRGSVIVRNVSVGVLIGIGAVLATPVVAVGVSASVAGAGFTGVTATTLTAVGTGTIVTGGGALAGGYVEAGVNVAEQALEGEGFDTEEFAAKTGGGMRQGAVSAFGGAVTAGTAGLFGEVTTLPGHVLRGTVSGSAGGAASGGLGATLEGKSLWEIAKATRLGGLEGAIGGAFGGATSSLTQGRSMLLRVSLETVGGGFGSGLGAAAAQKSPEEIAQSVLVGSIAGAAAEFGMPESAGPLSPRPAAESAGPPLLRPAAEPPAWQVVGEDVDYGIVIFKSSEGYVGIHPEYPDTVFIPQGNAPPTVFTKNPDGTILEVPWPFQKRVGGGTEPAGSIRLGADDEVVMHDPSLLPAEGAVFPRAETAEPGLVAAAPINNKHALSMTRDAGGRLELIVCSRVCRQLIALLDDLLIRSRVQYREAILALRERTTMVLEAFPVQEPDTPEGVGAVVELAGRVEQLRNLVGEEVMFEGDRIPVLPWRQLPEINFRNPREEAIPSLALPRDVGLHAPRPFDGDARGVTRRVLGDPPDIATAFERVPRIPYDPSIDWPLTGRLYSHEMTEGASGAPVYLTTLRIAGEPQMVAVKHFQREFRDYHRAEILYATILGELGVGPRVFGIVEIDGIPGLVMEPVAGDFSTVMPMGALAVLDLEVAVRRMYQAGIAIGDFQFFVTPHGRAVIIDAGGGAIRPDSQFWSFTGFMSERVHEERSLLEAPPESPELRDRYPDLEEARAVGTIFPEYTLTDWGRYVYGDRKLGIVQTPEGPQAWYIRTGGGRGGREGDPVAGEPARIYGFAQLQQINESDKTPISGKKQKWFMKPPEGGRMGVGNENVFQWLITQQLFEDLPTPTTSTPVLNLDRTTSKISRSSIIGFETMAFSRARGTQSARKLYWAESIS